MNRKGKKYLYIFVVDHSPMSVKDRFKIIVRLHWINVALKEGEYVGGLNMYVEQQRKKKNKSAYPRRCSAISTSERLLCFLCNSLVR